MSLAITWPRSMRWLMPAVLLSALPLSSGAAPANDAVAGAAFNGAWQRVGAGQILTPAEGGDPPFTAAGRARYRTNLAAVRKKDFAFDITTSLCSSPGLPRVMLAPGRMKLYARKDIVLIRFEWNRVFRQINLGKAREVEPPDSPITFNRGAEELLFGTMMGKADGKWMGDDLVVTSSGFSEKTLLDNVLPHSDQLRLTERLRLIDKDTLEDRIRIEDPETYARPWEVVLTYRRVPDQPFPEDVCLDRKQAGQPLWPH